MFENMFDFIATADLHINKQKPENRKGDYLVHCLDKLDQILKITEEQTKTKSLIVAGDFFDSSTVSYDTTREVIRIIKKHNINILVIPGQHDLRYHQSGLKNTPLGILLESGFVSMENSVDFALAGWNEEPKEEADILIIHKMVTEEFGLFPGHEYTNAKTILKQYPWARLIISGDNHRPHLVEYKNRFQLNCGSIMRKSKDQVDYEPAVWGINTFPKIKIKRIPLKVLPSNEVFDFDKIEKKEVQDEIKKEAQKLIDKFINEIENEENTKINFPQIVQKIVKETKPSKNVIKYVNDIMERIQK